MITRTNQNKRRQNILVQYIVNNFKNFVIVLSVFAVGMMIGIVFVNNASQAQQSGIQEYIQNFIASVKENGQIDKGALLTKDLIDNAVLTFWLWFVGSTVIGIPFVYAILCFRGVCLGYSIAAAVATLGTSKGALFCISNLLLQNMICIPCILFLAMSGMRLYQSIMKDKRKENIKVEVVRHTVLCLCILLALCASSFVEVYISSNLFLASVKFL